MAIMIATNYFVLIVVSSPINSYILYTDSLHVCIPKTKILNATENLLNMQVVRSGMVYLIINRMYHQ